MLPTPTYPIDSHQVSVQFLFTTLSLRFLAHEARQRDRFWKDTRGEVDKILNDEHTLMQVLSSLQEVWIKTVGNG